MTSVVLDAGALIALDRNDRSVWALLRVAADDERPVLVPAAVIAQAWRDGRRQVLLARALTHLTEISLDGKVARAAGVLCASARTADVVDATVALAAAGAARNGDVAVVTSDPNDIQHLLAAVSVAAALITV